jgi:succinyl-diaminopimelate desuccinylase
MSDFLIKILKDLVSFKSITPNDDGAIDYCSEFLSNLGFSCTKLRFENVSNLYAKLRDFKKNLCFAGHLDVVPPLEGWSFSPFALTSANGRLYGRGTNDMKGPLSACFAAVSDFLQNNNPEFSISFILTSDEEVMGDNGTKRVIEFLKEKRESITGCVLCESCSPGCSGEYIKIGCKGSLNIDLHSSGNQCHVVNSKGLGNHIHKFIELLHFFSTYKFDDGSENFSPTNLEVTSIDVGNNVRNIISPYASAKINIRFNDLWNFEMLENFIKLRLDKNTTAFFERFGNPFIGAKKEFIEFLQAAITKENRKPEIGTSGGNSDALFIKEITDVVEIGSPIKNAHIINEYIDIQDLIKLQKIYTAILDNFHDY